jgi:SAM-dependent methyltransferase
MSARQLVYNLIDLLGLQVDGFPNKGIAIAGYWLRRRSAQPGHVQAFRGDLALNECVGLGARSVLDVGSGGDEQAEAFVKAGLDVTCVDYGTSDYAQAVSAKARQLNIIFGDFNELPVDRRYDLVGASHVIEHQPNVGRFIEKLHAFCAEDGWVCITAPVCHRAMWGGHLTLWTPGLLAYNVALSGVDISSAQLIHGHREFSLLYQLRRVKLPTLTYDTGDIERLSSYLPAWRREGRDSW